jgi:pterin-4a-carbinolamine dehydratase
VVSKFGGFVLKDFGSAFVLLVSVTFQGNLIIHHLGIFNEYSKVDLTLFTHSPEKITQKDYDMAIETDRLLDT